MFSTVCEKREHGFCEHNWRITSLVQSTDQQQGRASRYNLSVSTIKQRRKQQQEVRSTGSFTLIMLTKIWRRPSGFRRTFWLNGVSGDTPLGEAMEVMRRVCCQWISFSSVLKPQKSDWLLVVMSGGMSVGLRLQSAFAGDNHEVREPSSGIHV